MKEEYWDTPKWFKSLLVALAIAWFILLLSSCTTQKKAVDYMNSHAFVAANYCANAFPVKDSIIYKPGQTIIKSDTSYIKGDSIPCPVNSVKERPVYVHCPPSRTIRDTIIKTDTVTHIQENIARISALTQQIGLLSDELSKAKPWRSRALWTWGILALIIGGGIFFKIIKL